MAIVFNVWIWLAIPIGLAALIYGGGPLLILLIFKNEAQPTLQPFEPSDQSLPLLVREHFKNACDELMPLGFEYIAVKGCLFDDLAEAVSAKADSPLVARSTGSTTTRGIGISQ
ncbi:MAG: hypothetical protein QGG09_00475, partial [Pirellulaceae bacterium]|nr:hypothetical protein [Pirellulaceae bacterium]